VHSLFWIAVFLVPTTITNKAMTILTWVRELIFGRHRKPQNMTEKPTASTNWFLVEESMDELLAEVSLQCI
jgi:hypothetical protein